MALPPPTEFADNVDDAKQPSKNLPPKPVVTEKIARKKGKAVVKQVIKQPVYDSTNPLDFASESESDGTLMSPSVTPGAMLLPPIADYSGKELQETPNMAGNGKEETPSAVSATVSDAMRRTNPGRMRQPPWLMLPQSEVSSPVKSKSSQAPNSIYTTADGVLHARTAERVTTDSPDDTSTLPNAAITRAFRRSWKVEEDRKLTEAAKIGWQLLRWFLVERIISVNDGPRLWILPMGRRVNGYQQKTKS
jgi:hypothetical protein